MADLADYTWDLDGYRFGHGLPVHVNNLTEGAGSWRTQNTPNPVGPGHLPGRDYPNGPIWRFDLAVATSAGAENLDEYGRLRTAWEAAAIRRRPGALSVLRYGLPGRRRRVYGRPADITPVGLHSALHGKPRGRRPVVADFELSDPLVYDDEAQSLTLQLVDSAGSGITLPARLPWTLGRSASQRQGQIVVGGRAEVPFEVTFYGPVTGSASGYWAAGPGWRVDVDATLAWDQSMTVDTRTHTVTRSDGLSLAGAARGRFLTARLSPGKQEIRFGASDPTNTARAEFTWRPGHHSL